VALGLELHWWDEADLAVEAPKVEPVDVLGDGDLKVVDVRPGSRLRTSSALNRLLNASAIALLGVALAPDRGDGAGLGEAFGVADGQVLHARSEWCTSAVVS